MLYEVLPEPGALVAPETKTHPVQVLQIHRFMPDTVQIGHFAPGAVEVIDDVVSLAAYLAPRRSSRPSSSMTWSRSRR